MKKELQSGQVLLLLIMLFATVITILLTVTFKSRTDIQTTRLEAESQKALAAAEAGVEKMLESNQTNPVNIGDIVGPDFSGQATSSTRKGSFVSPSVAKDHQYTFYLNDYTNGTFGNSHYGSPFTLYYDSTSTSAQDCLNYALEITIMSPIGSQVQMTRYIADDGTGFFNSSNHDLSVNQGVNHQIIDPLTQVATTFNCSVSINPGNNANIAIVRLMDQSSDQSAPFATAFGIDYGVTGTFPAQGRYVTSQATYTSGTSKIVQVFQPYPQIPAEFFVTSF